MIYLQFAGVNIALNFIPSGEPDFFEDPLFYNIKNSYSAYFINKCRVAHTINFHKIDDYEYFFNLREKKDYVLVSKRVGPRETDSFYHISMPQLQIILRNICQSEIAGEGVILHASSVVRGNEGYIFLGESGAGKSTIAGSLRPKFVPFADDSIIIKKEKKEWVMYQTPILQKNSAIIKTANPFKIGKFCFLHKSQKFSLNKALSKESVLVRLVKQVYTDKELATKQIMLVMELVSKKDDFYDLSFSLKGFEKIAAELIKSK